MEEQHNHKQHLSVGNYIIACLIRRAAPMLKSIAQRSGVSFDLIWPDGSRLHCGAGERRFCCRLRNTRAVLALLLRHDSRLGEAFLDGDIDLEGDLTSMLRLRSLFNDVSPLDHLRQIYLQPLLGGQTRQDKRWIHQHYDEAPEFYLSFLDRRHRCYSHGYFSMENESLEDAISRKLQTALDALRLPPGARILDVGAGWGAMTEFGAQRGYHMVSLTLSRQSEKFVNELIQKHSLSAAVVHGGSRAGSCQGFVIFRRRGRSPGVRGRAFG